MQAAEFEAFGPWIDRVRTLDEVPRLYRDAGIVPGAYRTVLKVPRNIDRRDAVPGMHLYDHLIAVDWENLTVLQRRGDRYAHFVVPLDRVGVLESSVNLLDGRLRIGTVDGGSIAVGYNAADDTPVRELIALLRDLYAPADPEPVDSQTAGLAGLGRVPVDLGAEDIGLVTVYREVLAAEPGMALVNATLRRTVAGAGGGAGALGRAWQRWRPVTLHAGIVVADNREVQVIHRREWFTTGPAKVRSVARTVLPRGRISGLRVLRHGRFEQVNVLVVEAGLSSVAIPVPAGADTEALVARLATPALPGDWISSARP